MRWAAEIAEHAARASDEEFQHMKQPGAMAAAAAVSVCVRALATRYRIEAERLERLHQNEEQDPAPPMNETALRAAQRLARSVAVRVNDQVNKALDDDD